MTDHMTNAEIEALEAELLVEALTEDGDLYTRALTAIRQLQQPWQGIESAPKDGTQILVPLTLGGIMAVVSWWGGMWREGTNGLGLRDAPTVYMPLPHAPDPGQ